VKNRFLSGHDANLKSPPEFEGVGIWLRAHPESELQMETPAYKPLPLSIFTLLALQKKPCGSF